MILLKFDYDKVLKAMNVDGVFRAMGIKLKPGDEGEVDIHDEEIFGKRGYYRNLIMNDDTYNDILAAMNNVPNYKGRKNPKNRMSYAAMQWMNFSPMSSGPRFEKVKELAGGEINRSVLYIITPDDELYEEDPTIGIK